MKAAFGTVARVIDVPSGGITYLRIELPVECHAEATQMFYGRRVLVTLTDIEAPFGLIEGGDTAQESLPDADAGSRTKGVASGRNGLSRSAAMVCQDRRFQQFIGVTLELPEPCSEERAAQYMRDFCGVASRAELDSNRQAAAVFGDLMSSYRSWVEDGEFTPW